MMSVWRGVEACSSTRLNVFYIRSGHVRVHTDSYSGLNGYS